MEEKSWLINKENGVFYLTPSSAKFEQAYTSVRAKENRMLTDEQVRELPFPKETNPHSNEWKKRLGTIDRFEKHLQELKPNRILDIGCGNGWFTARMAETGAEVVGLDVGKLELEQASRCFANENTHFVCCTDWGKLPANHFDCITFNASVHYFELTPDFWASLYRILKPNGEIHLLDSRVYSQSESDSAKDRSKRYFKQMEVPEAAEFYYHVCWENIPENRQIHYTPNKFLNKIFKNRSPFPWLSIQKPS